MIKRESALVGRLAVLAVDLSDAIDVLGSDDECREGLIQGLGQVVLHLEVVRDRKSAQSALFMSGDQIDALERNASQVADLGDSMLRVLRQPEFQERNT